ncbi:unnamed protein product [Ectocarpus sp. 4 AP-2014]
MRSYLLDLDAMVFAIESFASHLIPIAPPAPPSGALLLAIPYLAHPLELSYSAEGAEGDGELLLRTDRSRLRFEMIYSSMIYNVKPVVQGRHPGSQVNSKSSSSDGPAHTPPVS